MNEKQSAGLQKAIEDARILGEMLKHDGWTKVLEQRINSIIQDKHKTWLKAKSAEVAEILRLRVSGYEGVLDVIKKVLLEGKNAQILLANSDRSQNNSQGEVNDNR